MLATPLTRRSLIAVLPGTVVGAAAVARAQQSSSNVTALLEKRTQQLIDAITPGDKEPWRQYAHESLIYSAEDGSTKSKAELLDELRPIPAEVRGVLRVTKFRAIEHTATVVTNYVIDELQTYHGQQIRSRYMTTDTWIKVGNDWQLAAAQVLALRDDPPAIAVSPAVLDAYVGEYSLTPTIAYTIARGADGLTGQRTGRSLEVLRVEVVDCLFVPGEPRLRKVFQRTAEGRVTGFVERRESWDIRWQRVR